MVDFRWLSENEQCAWRSFLASHAYLTAQLNRQLQHDSELSLADFEVLVQLTDREGEPVRVLELARALQWEKSRLSHQVARMRARGLVRSEKCASDGRGSYVSLTPEGRQAIEEAAPRHVETVRELFFDALNEDQVAALHQITEQVRIRQEPAS